MKEFCKSTKPKTIIKQMIVSKSLSLSPQSEASSLTHSKDQNLSQYKTLDDRTLTVSNDNSIKNGHFEDDKVYHRFKVCY